ncbi:lipoprotein [Pseudodesulfovibrio indicus]|uniref:Uncharacterized protein n=1 Tax=Pseudodesulfovibrio indicus TaxID=1716143 RepID=A0A126QLG5_9BACT|nr:lipoprotein [Pseudodesulfovibrio indicus]AMK10518.1 hypothetical protein AWY79_04985 [Pseudodesulfovibrio indicus]TDT89083.1 hypothetical protein EDC59_10476 [Pseudodesulfovibrio indicus]
MRKFHYAFFLLLALFLLAGCSGDEVADDPKLSDEGKEIASAVGGPFTADEFEKFLADLPAIPGLTTQGQQDMGEVSDGPLSAAILGAVKARGWSEERFMYIYSHAMTMMNVEQMHRAMGQMQEQFKDMPAEQRQAMEQMMGQQLSGQMEAYQAEVDKQVPASEQAIILDNMDGLYKALGMQR